MTVPVPPSFVLIVSGLFGAMLGSFLNVVIYRLPRGENLAWPGSHCPECGMAIRWYDNLPLLSWLLLRGRCRVCRKPISWRYPLVEGLTAGLTVLMAWRFLTRPATAEWWLFVAALAFGLALVPVTFIDLEHRIIPDRITKPGMVAGPLLSLLAPGLHQVAWLPQIPPAAAAFVLSLSGMAVGAGSIWFMGWLGKSVFRKEAMGFGDVKFMGMVGGFLGPIGALFTILLGCVVGSVVGILSWIVTRSHYIPFGPFLSIGAVVVLLFRPEVVYFVTVTYPRMFR